MPKWYSEKLNPLGRWCSQVTTAPPSKKSANGGKVKLRSIVQIDEQDEHRDLRALYYIYSESAREN